MEERVWITQAPGLSLIEKTSTYERGTYYVFDALTWRKVPKEFLLEYSKLEGRPTVPNVPLTTPNLLWHNEHRRGVDALPTATEPDVHQPTTVVLNAAIVNS